MRIKTVNRVAYLSAGAILLWVAVTHANTEPLAAEGIQTATTQRDNAIFQRGLLNTHLGNLNDSYADVLAHKERVETAGGMSPEHYRQVNQYIDHALAYWSGAQTSYNNAGSYIDAGNVYRGNATDKYDQGLWQDSLDNSYAAVQQYGQSVAYSEGGMGQTDDADEYFDLAHGILNQYAP